MTLAVAAFVFVFAIGALTWQFPSVTSAREVDPVGGQAHRSAIPRGQIIARVTDMRAIVKRADRIDARLTTWSDYLKSHDLQTQFLEDPNPPSTPVWVVSAAGEFVPAHSGESYSWGVIVFNALTGEWLFTEASSQSSWPAFFDTLPNITKS